MRNKLLFSRKYLFLIAFIFVCVGTIFFLRSQAATNSFDFYVGYVDGNSRGFGKLPNPWRDSPGVLFVGKSDTTCCTAANDSGGNSVMGWDAGAFRLDNKSTAPMSVYVKVTNMELCNRDWPEQQVPAGGTLILTTTSDSVTSGNPGYWDTSDTEWLCQGVAFGATNCNDYTPHIELKVNGTTYNYVEPDGILTARGRDTDCTGIQTPGYEFHEWSLLGSGDGGTTPPPPGPTPTPTPPSTGGTWTELDDTNAAIKYTPASADEITGWPEYESGEMFGGTYHSAHQPGNSFAVTFSGTGIRVYGDTSDHAGSMDVKIDGVAAGTIDFYSAQYKVRQKVYEKTGLTAGEHTMVATLSGKNAASTGNYVSVDQVDVLSGGGTTPPPAPTPTPPPSGALIPEDINEDTRVNFLDLVILMKNWKSTNATLRMGDIDANGMIDIIDLSQLISAWTG